MKEETKAGPSTRHPQFEEMRNLAILPRLLREGTKAMRESKDWTPQNPGESPEAYTLRKRRSFLLGRYEDASEQVVDALFGGELVVEPPEGVKVPPSKKPTDPEGEKVESEAPFVVPEDVKSWLEDFDGEGRSAEEWLLENFADAIDVGAIHCLSDHPLIEGAETLEEEQRRGARPYAVLIRGDEILQVETERLFGRERLKRINIERPLTVSDGAWGVRATTVTLVIYAGDPRETDLSVGSPRFARWEIYEKNEKGEDREIPSRSGSYRPHIEIPLDSFYTRRTGFMTARPALLRLAEKNAEHWQSASHQRFHLDFARFAQLFRKGFSDEEKKQEKVGSHVVWSARSEGADLKLVETTGGALGAGRQHLEDCKVEMDEMSFEPFLKMSASTAAEVAVAKGEANTKVEAWSVGLGRFLTSVFNRFRRWTTPAGKEPTPFGSIGLRINRTLVITPQQLEFMKFLRTNGDLDQESILRAGKESGVLPAWLDVAKVINRTANETPKLLGLPFQIGSQDGEKGGEGEGQASEPGSEEGSTGGGE